MVTIQFYPLDIGHETDESGKSMIQLFGRTLDGKKVCVFDESYLPSFYVIPKKYKIDELKRKIDNIKREDYRVIESKIVDRNYLREPVKAVLVFADKPISVKAIAEEIKEFEETSLVKETDIPFDRKYLIDKNITPNILCYVEGEVLVDRQDLDVDFVIKTKEIKQIYTEEFSKPKILAFDIEVYAPEGRYPHENKDPIIMIGFAGNDGFRKVLTWKKYGNAEDYVKFVSDEKKLIWEFKNTINKYDPDYIVGYFSDGFDFPYIKARAKKYQINLKFNNYGLRINKRGNMSTAKLKGIAHLDVFKFIRNIMSGSLKLDEYSLANVSRELLGKEKHDVDLNQIGVVWDNGSTDIGKYCAYNLQDSVLALELCEKILPNLDELVKLINLPLYDVCRLSYSKIVEKHLMRRAKEMSEIIPNRPDQGMISTRMMHTYEGASVIQPKPGLYENLAIFDFTGFWPSIIVAHNICVTTLTDEKEGHESPEIVLESGEKSRHYFSSKKEGFIPAVLREVITRRIRVKGMLKRDPDNKVLGARSYALKTVANATYGYFAFFGARWYCKECSESITAWGRDYINQVISAIREKGFEVVYSDTDSIFFSLGERSKEEALKILDVFNQTLPSLMELDVEGFYPKGIFVSKKSESSGAKKKYALIDEKDKIKVVGFETIRRDWSYLAKETQRKVLEIVLREGDPEKAYDYVRQVVEDVKDKKFDIQRMVIQTQLKKSIESYQVEGPHVFVAKKMIANGVDVEVGSVIRYVVGEGTGRVRDRAEIPEEAKTYDADYYINNQIVPSVDRIFSVLGYKKEELVDGKKQKTLGDF